MLCNYLLVAMLLVMYVFAAMVLWLCPCSNGVVVMHLKQRWCGYVLVAMALWLCTCSNDVVVMNF